MGEEMKIGNGYSKENAVRITDGLEPIDDE